MTSSPRVPAPPPPELIRAQAKAFHGVAIVPARAEAVAGDVAAMVAAVERALPRKRFEDEPAAFARVLRQAAR